jgi:hypothetical protein
MSEICWYCETRRGERIHHALITQKMASKCGKELKKHIESLLNKPPICDFCHTGNGNHVSRKRSKEVILKHHTQKEIDTFFDEADKLTKTRFKRI